MIDYKMPDINGIELVVRLRKSDRDTPVILITGYQTRTSRLEPPRQASMTWF
ncbi:CheY-like chemotaxis protein [Bradyrhizobium sp. LA6.1]